jgi:NADH-quinone oxidoreductase subunit N
VPGILVIGLSALAVSAGVSVFSLVRDAAPQNLFYGLLAFDRFSNLFRLVFAFVDGRDHGLLDPVRRPERARRAATRASSSACSSCSPSA